jgi:hypothetical protein
MTSGNWLKGMTLVLHVIYGLVLGAVYGLERPDPTHAFQGLRT